MLGKIEGRKRRQQQRMRWLDSITASVDMNLSKLCIETENLRKTKLKNLEVKYKEIGVWGKRMLYQDLDG